MTLRAAIVGVGRIGSRFDEEPGRKMIWSHAGAYLACADQFALVGAAEPDDANAEAFRRRCPEVPLYETAEKMLGVLQPDIVSICTPPEQHQAVLDAALRAPSVRAIWCEKPLSTELRAAEHMVAACAAKGVPLVVSHVRRWLPLWRRVADRIAEGAIGTPVVIRIATPNRLFSIGSHAVDLALMLGGEPSRLATLPLPALAEDGEPAVAALIGFKSGVYGMLQVTGFKHDLMIEAEVIGTEGRLFAREDDGVIALERFAKSPRYDGYRQLSGETREQAATFDDASPFVAIAKELAELVREPTRRAGCSGADALKVQSVLAELERACGTADQGVQS